MSRALAHAPTSAWLARLLAALYLCGLVLPSAHLIALEHDVCPQDGELVHSEPHGDDHGDHGERDQHGNESDEEHDHDDCVANALPSVAIGSDKSTPLTRSAVAHSRALPTVIEWLGPERPRYALAPKNSPPRC